MLASDDSVEAARKHLYRWVPYDTREVCCSDDREEAAQKHLLNGPHTKTPYEDPHNANRFAVVMVIV